MATLVPGLVKLPNNSHTDHMKHKRTLTPEQIKAVEGMAKVRLPVEMMATILEMDKRTFERMTKTNAALRAAIDKGRSNGSGKIRNTLFAMATKDGGKDQFNALKFWCQTQEGFKTADRIEISGPEGRPIEVRELTKEQRLATLKELNRKLKLTEDE